MNPIVDLAGLPPSLADAIRTMVETLRHELPCKEEKAPAPPLPLLSGTIHGRLTRDAIYDDRP